MKEWEVYHPAEAEKRELVEMSVRARQEERLRAEVGWACACGLFGAVNSWRTFHINQKGRLT